MYLRLISVLCVLCFACSPDHSKQAPKVSSIAKTSIASAVQFANELPLHKIKLPAGFKIETYAEGIDNARSLDLAPNGVLFVGTRSLGNVYALKDTDGDMKADLKYLIDEDLNMPNGVAYKGGDLYVAEVNRVLKYEHIMSLLDNPPKPKVIFDEYPVKKHHGWKYIAFGPDGKLYIPVGAPCNICESKRRVFNTITRLDVETAEMEIVQEGIRNTVGFTWHPDTDELWFTDNGRDHMGDDLPACELNHAPMDHMHFGYPYCHQGDLEDPEFGHKRDCSEFTPPVQNLGPHVAPLGLEFYTGTTFPDIYKKQIFIAEHGSWNRSSKIGYRVSLVTLDEFGDSKDYSSFASGWLEGEENWGRPVDLEIMPDGSMLVSDDFANAVYRISYTGD